VEVGGVDLRDHARGRRGKFHAGLGRQEFGRLIPDRAMVMVRGIEAGVGIWGFGTPKDVVMR